MRPGQGREPAAFVRKDARAQGIFRYFLALRVIIHRWDVEGPEPSTSQRRYTRSITGSPEPLGTPLLYRALLFSLPHPSPYTPPPLPMRAHRLSRNVIRSPLDDTLRDAIPKRWVIGNLPSLGLLGQKARFLARDPLDPHGGVFVEVAAAETEASCVTFWCPEVARGCSVMWKPRLSDYHSAWFFPLRGRRQVKRSSCAERNTETGEGPASHQTRQAADIPNRQHTHTPRCSSWKPITAWCKGGEGRLRRRTGPESDRRAPPSLAALFSISLTPFSPPSIERGRDAGPRRKRTTRSSASWESSPTALPPGSSSKRPSRGNTALPHWGIILDSGRLRRRPTKDHDRGPAWLRCLETIERFEHVLPTSVSDHHSGCPCSSAHQRARRRLRASW